MNFLAHAYLSFGEPGLLVGNMISDFVKGSARYRYPAAIQAGITLHRKIDCFTDEHAATKEARQFFRSAYRLYSGPIVDVLYDHFLATDATVFPGDALSSFSNGVYETLEAHADTLPPRFLWMLPYMKGENWLYGYQYREGIAKSLRGLVRRSRYMTEHETAYGLFNEHYEELRRCYSTFFSDVASFAKQERNRLVI